MYIEKLKNEIKKVFFYFSLSYLHYIVYHFIMFSEGPLDTPHSWQAPISVHFLLTSSLQTSGSLGLQLGSSQHRADRV